jgi:hypothetical protein
MSIRVDFGGMHSTVQTFLHKFNIPLFQQSFSFFISCTLVDFPYSRATRTVSSFDSFADSGQPCYRAVQTFVYKGCLAGGGIM